MIVAAYAVSLLFVERLFKTVKPKLMTIGWFARMWVSFVGLRDKVTAWASGRPVIATKQTEGLDRKDLGAR
jgi:hypothetical protein